MPRIKKIWGVERHKEKHNADDECKGKIKK